MAQDDIDDDIAEMNQLMENYFRNGELEELAHLYLDEAYLLSPGTTITGRDEINEYWMNIKNPVDWELEIIGLAQSEQEIYDNQYYQALENKPPGWRQRGIELDDDLPLIYQLGRSTLKSRGANGELNTSIVDFLLIWQVQNDGSYKIILDSYVW